MMIDSSTSCKNVCAIHEMIAGLPALIASGRLISAISTSTSAIRIGTYTVRYVVGLVETIRF